MLTIMMKLFIFISLVLISKFNLLLICHADDAGDEINFNTMSTAIEMRVSWWWILKWIKKRIVWKLNYGFLTYHWAIKLECNGTILSMKIFFPSLLIIFIDRWGFLSNFLFIFSDRFCLILVCQFAVDHFHLFFEYIGNLHSSSMFPSLKYPISDFIESFYWIHRFQFFTWWLHFSLTIDFEWGDVRRLGGC